MWGDLPWRRRPAALTGERWRSACVVAVQLMVCGSVLGGERMVWVEVFVKGVSGERLVGRGWEWRVER